MHDPPIPEGIFGPYLGPLYVCKSPNDMNGLFVLDTDRVTERTMVRPKVESRLQEAAEKFDVARLRS